MQRIVIVGSGGSGKSTLAREMGDILELDVIHLDTAFWKPGWVRLPAAEQVQFLQEAVLRDSWIIDGDHLRTQELRFQAADSLIFLDFPRPLCLWRLVYRAIKYRGTNRPEVARGCPERLNRVVLTWVWRYPIDCRPNVLSNLTKYEDGQTVVILRSPAQVKEFVAMLRKNH